MKLFDRGLRDDDIAAMRALVDATPEEHRHVIDLPYRLCSPALDTPANARLWENEQGRLVAWAVWQQPFITLDYAIDPAVREAVADRLITWAIRRFREIAREMGRPLDYFIDTREDDAASRAWLEGHGFAPDPTWQLLHLRRPLADPLAAADVPPGFVMRSLAGSEEAAAAGALHRAAFGTENMTDEWRRRIVRTPAYTPDLDVVAEAPDGRLAAFCLCWLHQSADGQIEGQVEPLGVHPEFQRLGLGRAVLLEGLRRMQAHGARVAYIEADSTNEASQRLYMGAGGFQVAYRALKYCREF